MSSSPQTGPDDITAALPGGPNSGGRKSGPIRVPNVSPDAKSGLDHQVIGSNAQEAYAATEAEVTVPEDLTTVDAVLEWVREDESTSQARAKAALDAEQAKSEEDQRSTLVGPLEALLAAADDSGDSGDDLTPDDADIDPGNPDLSGNGEGVPSDGDGIPATP